MGSLGIKILDLFAGRPLLWFLAFFMPSPPKSPVYPKRIVFAHWGGLGSAVHCLPLLKSLRQSGAKVAFWSDSGASDLVRISGLADEVWAIEASWKRWPVTLWASAKKARAFLPDTFVVLNRALSLPALLALFCGPLRRIGWERSAADRGRFLNGSVDWSARRNGIGNHLALAPLLGVPIHPAALPSIPSSLHEVSNPFPRRNLRERIVIRLGAVWPRKRWMELCDHILADPTVELILPGTLSEVRMLENLVDLLPSGDRVLLCAGRTSVLELLRLLREADIVVAADTDFAALAKWMAVPVLTVAAGEDLESVAKRLQEIRSGKRGQGRAA